MNQEPRNLLRLQNRLLNSPDADQRSHNNPEPSLTLHLRLLGYQKLQLLLLLLNQTEVDLLVDMEELLHLNQVGYLLVEHPDI